MTAVIQLTESDIFDLQARIRRGTSPDEIEAALDAFEREFGHRPGIVYVCGRTLAIPLTDGDCSAIERMPVG